MPQKKIAVASSFEGVVNNGARECALVSFNAYHRLLEKKQVCGHRFMDVMEPDRFNREAKRDAVVNAFLNLRPLVAVAEDYLTVIQIISLNLQHLPSLQVREAEEVFRFFKKEFESAKQATPDSRAAFKEAFYAERKRLQEADYGKWLSLQQPYEDTVQQLRILAKLRALGADGKVSNGFALYYVTTKDAKSTWELCTVYGKLGSLEAGEVSDGIKAGTMDWPGYLAQLSTCLIKKDHILAKENGSQPEKMKAISDAEGIPPGLVWRLNDRYDEKEAAELKAGGFPYFVVTGGYAFPWDYEKARSAGITVIKRERLAESLSSIAKEKGI